jgi:hypothetical protein
VLCDPRFKTVNCRSADGGWRTAARETGETFVALTVFLTDSWSLADTSSPGVLAATSRFVSSSNQFAAPI